MKLKPYWNPWWVTMWAMSVALLVVLGFLVPFTIWSPTMMLLLGVPEMLVSAKHRPSYPSVFTIIAAVIPKWIGLPLVYGFAAVYIAALLGQPNPEQAGLAVAVSKWFAIIVEKRFDESRSVRA